MVTLVRFVPIIHAKFVLIWIWVDFSFSHKCQSFGKTFSKSLTCELLYASSTSLNECIVGK